MLGYELVPAADYPSHLTIMGLLRYRFSDPESFGAVFGTRLLQPYWGFYLPALLLSVAMPLELAAKLVLGAALLAIPWSIILIARREEFDPRTALAAGSEFPRTFSYETMSSQVDYFLFHSPKYLRGASDDAPMLVDSMFLGAGIHQVHPVCEVGS